MAEATITYKGKQELFNLPLREKLLEKVFGLSAIYLREGIIPIALEDAKSGKIYEICGTEEEPQENTKKELKGSEIKELILKMRELDITIPKISKIRKNMGLKDLVQLDMLEVGSKVSFTFKDKKYFGQVDKCDDKVYLVYSKGNKVIKDETPGGWISKVVAPEDSTGYNWQSVRLLNGTTLKQIKDKYFSTLVGTEILRIEHVLGVQETIIKRESGNIRGFHVFVDANQDFNKLKQEYPILNDEAIILEGQEPLDNCRDSLKIGKKFGGLPGTLGCYCRNAHGSHFAITAGHVALDSEVGNSDFPIGNASIYNDIHCFYLMGIWIPLSESDEAKKVSNKRTINFSTK